MGVIGRLIHLVIIILGCKVGLDVALIGATIFEKAHPYAGGVGAILGFGASVYIAHCLGKWVSNGNRSE
ncbi:MAG: hypothetical protein ACRDCE_19545 [Cetobacterium sp.]|uniref:hypothetical protein n=1 Tax=Cetobacterium sp. TaxID=2071632 RepID=UPI003EE43DAA